MADEKLYPPDMKPWKLEPHYGRHVAALTSEGLHSKAAIAEQLAWRDQQIESLRVRIAELEQAQPAIAIAPEIKPDSWLNDAQYAWFRKAYGYASTQTHAIYGLAKLHPTEAFHVFASALRGLGYEVTDGGDVVSTDKQAQQAAAAERALLEALRRIVSWCNTLDRRVELFRWQPDMSGDLYWRCDTRDNDDNLDLMTQFAGPDFWQMLVEVGEWCKSENDCQHDRELGEKEK